MSAPTNQLSYTDLKDGYRFDEARQTFCCLSCEVSYHQDEVYPIDDHFYHAKAAMLSHISTQHPPLERLLALDKKDNGLTEIQRTICRMLAEGLSDKDISKRLAIEPVTVRKHRFTLREHAKTARVQLAIFELLGDALLSRGTRDPQEELVETSSNSSWIDDRFVITKAEEDQTIKAAFKSLKPLILKQIPAREKKKLIVLRVISQQFTPGQKYSETEVNIILKGVHEDFASLRRHLIDYRFLIRKSDGSAYWLAE